MDNEADYSLGGGQIKGIAKNLNLVIRYAIESKGESSNQCPGKTKVLGEVGGSSNPPSGGAWNGKSRNCTAVCVRNAIGTGFFNPGQAYRNVISATGKSANGVMQDLLQQCKVLGGQLPSRYARVETWLAPVWDEDNWFNYSPNGKTFTTDNMKCD